VARLWGLVAVAAAPAACAHATGVWEREKEMGRGVQGGD
jgi:hypothetical protein